MRAAVRLARVIAALAGDGRTDDARTATRITNEVGPINGADDWMAVADAVRVSVPSDAQITQEVAEELTDLALELRLRQFDDATACSTCRGAGLVETKHVVSGSPMTITCWSCGGDDSCWS